jgi:hypothetical protein
MKWARLRSGQRQLHGIQDFAAVIFDEGDERQLRAVPCGRDGKRLLQRARGVERTVQLADDMIVAQRATAIFAGADVADEARLGDREIQLATARRVHRRLRAVDLERHLRARRLARRKQPIAIDFAAIAQDFGRVDGPRARPLPRRPARAGERIGPADFVPVVDVERERDERRRQLEQPSDVYSSTSGVRVAPDCTRRGLACATVAKPKSALKTVTILICRLRASRHLVSRVTNERRPP